MPTQTIRTTLIAAVAVAAAGALIAPAAASPSLSTTTTTTTAARPASHGHDRTQQAIEALVREGVPGVVAQTRDRQGAWSGTAGVGDLRTGKSRSAQDRYRVGSITKTFVATVLLQLEAEGRLDLDDSVHRWLPGVVSGNGHDGRRITVRQLLNHTSGVYNYTDDPGFVRRVFGDGFFQHRYDTWQPRRLVDIALRHKPYFAPGADWHYSNTNYVLAGLVIEKATGRPYGSEIERRILRPLKLRATSVPGTDHRVPQPASRGYSKLSEDPTATKIHDVTELNPSAAYAAGEMISDSGDLQRFYRALLKGALLPPKQQKALTDTVPIDPNQSGVGYGLGLMSQKLSCGKEVWGHGGGIHGSNSRAAVTRDGDHSLAMNFNGDWMGDRDAVLEAEYCR
ncbi:serine hydrolase domain-containing protein [Streptomyces albipurpureus]|uniref:Beta-lactamase family protein n=1 Tax=Streptomyces albipurpureus TaxID=2897419 RepID=A0ABT0UWF8_9ACTN|nr:serine hydrolase domain-containing protein [Streptomyces sp. CWNU-1]MCM2391975.1 beta-lactamase family protein [Streptomyces sp. CWNU-1]